MRPFASTGGTIAFAIECFERGLIGPEQTCGLELRWGNTEAIVDMEEAFGRDDVPLSLRGGLASGPVILFEGDDYIGSAVNMAARLCDAARDVDVLMPTMHLDRLPGAASGHRDE